MKRYDWNKIINEFYEISIKITDDSKWLLLEKSFYLCVLRNAPKEATTIINKLKKLKPNHKKNTQ